MDYSTQLNEMKTKIETIEAKRKDECKSQEQLDSLEVLFKAQVDLSVGLFKKVAESMHSFNHLDGKSVKAGRKDYMHLRHEMVKV